VVHTPTRLALAVSLMGVGFTTTVKAQGRVDGSSLPDRVAVFGLPGVEEWQPCVGVRLDPSCQWFRIVEATTSTRPDRASAPRDEPSIADTQSDAGAPSPQASHPGHDEAVVLPAQPQFHRAEPKATPSRPAAKMRFKVASVGNDGRLQRAKASTGPDDSGAAAQGVPNQVEVGTDSIDVRARVLDGPERDAIWSLQKQRYPGFAGYEQQTTRVIPVVLLERR